MPPYVAFVCILIDPVGILSSRVLRVPLARNVIDKVLEHLNPTVELMKSFQRTCESRGLVQPHTAQSFNARLRDELLDGEIKQRVPIWRPRGCAGRGRSEPWQGLML